jgi:hypothetical protein
MKYKYQFIPDLLPEEYKLLRASIAQRGVDIPIIVDKKGEIIDGFCRQRVCEELSQLKNRLIRGQNPHVRYLFRVLSEENLPVEEDVKEPN